MLVVLSEMNCYKSLTGRGVNPDYFYTDLHKFRNMATYFDNATVVVILIGTSRFNRRQVKDVIGVLRKRVDSGDDSGIKNLIVMSDEELSQKEGWYKLVDGFSIIEYREGKKVISKNSDIISKLVRDTSDCKMFLSDQDTGTYKTPPFSGLGYEKEMEIEKKIIKPNIKELLSSQN